MRPGKYNSAFLKGRLLVIASVLSLLAGGCVSGKVAKIPDFSEIDVRGLAGGLGNARVLFVGELHDDRTHHRLQLDVIKALHEGGHDVAVGLEMFSSASNGELDRWVSGDMDEREFKDVFFRQWHLPYRNYRSIFRYARDNSIPLVGLNIPRSLVHKVFKDGTGALAGEEEAEGLAGIECDADEKYEELIRDAMGDHPDIEDSYERFCETQMVWDMAMAIRVVRYLKENPARKLVVIAGSVHAWRRGIARQMQKLPGGAEYKYVAIIPELPGQLDRTNINKEDTDYLLLDPWM